MNRTARIIGAGALVGALVTAVSVAAPGASGTDHAAGVGVPIPAPGAIPFPTSGTVPVVTPTPTGSAVSASGAPSTSAQEKTHNDGANAPYGDSGRVRAEARVIASIAAKLNKRSTPSVKPYKPAAKPKITYIPGYSYCGPSAREAQRCIDKGYLTLYYPAGVNTLAGHNYKGWYWIDDIPTGRTVVIKGHGKLAGKYKVYGHAKVYNKKFPRSGLGADVALQTCEGSGIGFSFLRRV